MTKANQNPISFMDRIEEEKRGDGRANRKIYTFVNTPLKRDLVSTRLLAIHVAIRLNHKNFKSETSNVSLKTSSFLKPC